MRTRDWLLLATIGVSGPVSAQAFTQNVPLMSYTDATRGIIPDYNAFSPYRSGDTPTMRRQKEQWANTLRAQAASWLEQDGGVLTPEHRSYVRGEARRILTGSRF